MPLQREYRKTSSQTIRRIGKLAADGLRDDEIAQQLETEGLRTGTNLAWQEDHVRQLRRRNGIARTAVGQHAAPQVFGELTLDVTGQSTTFRVGRAHLGEHRLRVPRDELVQYRTLGVTASVAGKRLSGRTRRSFVQTTREHALAS